MPILRFGVRNEYGLGGRELYKEGVEAEDPKAVLDGVAVAGLVGLLRQLGDLSQFAAEVFHGLQEQVASTSSRSRKLVSRVQRVEASLPTLEKAILSQTSHIHLAYTPGSEWHPRIRNEQNHFVCDDLPHFIMDSYEECREPPRLQLLDRFDTGGPGSCLKRYSDPTFFRRASASSQALNREKVRERKARKIKRRRSLQKSGQFQSYTHSSGREHISSQAGQEHFSLSHTGSTFDVTFKSDLRDHSDSLGSKEGSDFVECVSHPSTSIKPVTKNKEVSSAVDEVLDGSRRIYLNEHTAVVRNDSPNGFTSETTVLRSSNVTWDEKLEIMEQTCVDHGTEDIQHVPETDSYVHEQNFKVVPAVSVNQEEDFVEQVTPRHHVTPKPNVDQLNSEASMNVKSMDLTGLDYLHEQAVKPIVGTVGQVDEISERGSSPESYGDDQSTITTIDRKSRKSTGPSWIHEPEENHINAESFNRVDDLSAHGSSPKANVDGQYPRTILDGNFLELAGLGFGIDEVQDVHETNFDLDEHETNSDLDDHDLAQAMPYSLPQVKVLSEGENIQELAADSNVVSEPSDRNLGIGEVQHMLGSNLDSVELEGEAVIGEHVGDSFPQASNLYENENVLESTIGNFASDPSNSNLSIVEVPYGLDTDFDNDKWDAETICAERIGNVDNFSEGGFTANAIEWHQHDDVDSETDNFVDALNSIESESESEFETQAKKEVKLIKLSSSKYKQEDDAVTDDSKPAVESHLRSGDQKKGVLEISELPTESVPSAEMGSLENVQPLQDKSEGAMCQKPGDLPCLSHEQSVQSTQSSTLSNISPGTYATAAEIRLQPAVCETTSISQAFLDDRTTSTPHVPQEVPFVSSGSYPLAFWTNGSLLGLQPSKPTVISTANSVNSAPISCGNGDIVGQCSPKVNGIRETLPSSVKNSDHGQNLGSDDQVVGSSGHVSDKKYGKSLEHSESDIKDHSVNRGLVNGDAKGEVFSGADSKNVFSGPINASEDRSSLISLLGHGLLNNGLQRSESMGNDEKKDIGDRFTSDDLEKKSPTAVSLSIPETNLYAKLQSPESSPPPSPPLEHMKISFRPIDGFEVCRLKLKYPEAIDQHENTVDAFPSFQLVPESTRLQHDMGSDSDDDTFCRSYPCMSDASPSHLSNSDWESGDSSDSDGHAINDSLRRISSAASASCSPQHDDTDQERTLVGSRCLKAVHAMSDPTSHISILDSKEQFAYEEMKACLNPDADSSHLQELVPQLPPLPPLQWRVSRPLSDAVEDKQEPGSHSLTPSLVSKHLEAAVSHPVELDSTKVESKIQKKDMIAKLHKVDGPKSHSQRKDYPTANGRMPDDGGDFLHQIRTKSFNLKRTEQARSFYSPSAAASNKITLILEKANAIRQAVASDAEDDSWSDT